MPHTSQDVVVIENTLRRHMATLRRRFVRETVKSEWVQQCCTDSAVVTPLGRDQAAVEEMLFGRSNTRPCCRNADLSILSPAFVFRLCSLLRLLRHY